jgi:DNA-binding NtrC family response regulator
MRHKRIFIFDEAGFARVCSALLESAGYEAEIAVTPAGLPSVLDRDDHGLFITSYPFGAPIFEEIKKRRISAIILADDFDESLVAALKDFNNAYCMIKPVDYGKFRSLVKEVMSGKLDKEGGYHILV